VKRVPAWPVLAAYAVVFLVGVDAAQQLVLAVGRARSDGDEGRALVEATRFALSLPGLSAVAAMNAVLLAGVAVVAAAWIGRADADAGSVGAMLGLAKPRAHVRGLIAAVLGAVALDTACSAAVDLFEPGGSALVHHVTEALAGMKDGPASVAVTAIAALVLLAPFGEEVFFRGLMMRRLERSHGAGLAVVASAACFGALHLDAVQGAVAFVVGCWLGLVAWRFGSTFVALAAHATSNLLSVLLARGTLEATASHAPYKLGAGLLVTLACAAIVLSRRALPSPA
jgi:membrane protease YdiL (CAAX protease family)